MSQVNKSNWEHREDDGRVWTCTECGTEGSETEMDRHECKEDKVGCDCHDDQEQHEKEQAEEMAYWKAYFGNAVRIQGEIDRLLRADGIDPADQHQIQERLKR